MKGLVLVLPVLAIAFAAVAQEPTPVPAPSATTAPATTTTTPQPDLVDDIIRLWKANLSEEFIDKYVANSALARDLTADEVVRLRSAGVPESLIAYVTTHAPDAESRTPAAAPGPAAVRRWDGLVRRNPGLVLFKSRWDPGTLEFKDGSLRWTDSSDTAKNVLVPVEQISEQQLKCLKKSGGNECFEWVVKTRDTEYRFRDVAWRQGRNETVEQIFEFFHGAYPNLIASRVPVDEK